MQDKAIKLPDSFINKLINLPESGMGYQVVKIFLKTGQILHQRKVINSEFLMLEENEVIPVKEIDKIELESN